MNKLTEKSTSPKLKSLNGAKVLSMAGIILGHRVLHSYGLGLYNPQYWELVCI